MNARRRDDESAVASGIEAGPRSGRRSMESARDTEPKCRPPPPLITVRVGGNGPCLASSAARLAAPMSPSTSKTQKPERAGRNADVAIGKPPEPLMVAGFVVAA